MRYYSEKNTLFIRGSFRAASTGAGGGLRSVSSLLNHTVPPDRSHEQTERELEFVAARAGIGGGFFGLLTTVPVRNLCVIQYDFVTVFITAGIRDEPPGSAGTITIIVCSNGGMEDAALLETIMVVAEAKAEALHTMGLLMTGTPTDAVIVACEGEMKYRYAGRLTEVGKRVREAVLHGIPEALARYNSPAPHAEPAFFIFSRFGGAHWMEWTPHDCPYYPCHFAGQSCDFCYCPFYPCGDERLGQWVDSSGGGRVWNCARCTLLHEPAIADYQVRYPDASKEELMRLRDGKKERG